MFKKGWGLRLYDDSILDDTWAQHYMCLNNRRILDNNLKYESQLKMAGLFVVRSMAYWYMKFYVICCFFNLLYTENP